MMPRTLPKSIAVVAAALLTGAPAARASETGATTPASSPAPAVSSVAATEPPLVISTGTLTLRTSSAALEGHTLAFFGHAPARYAHRTVTIERYDKANGAWISAASAAVDSRGGFLADWRANLSGRVAIRALIARGSGAVAADSSPPGEITIYRPAIATYFGEGFYGKQTACGQTLKPELIGVANRTLPCGTLVEVSYAGRRLTVPVIDRGPYANGASWDLTEAAAQALGVSETVRIGTLIAGSTPNVPTLGLSAEALAIEAQATLTGGASA